MSKPFSEVAVGSVFTYNGIQYTKTADERVSCCKIINAVDVNNPKNRIFFQPQSQVEEPTV